MSESLTFTDEKLEDYLGVWNRLVENGQRKNLDIAVKANYDCSRFPFGPWVYTIIYGEEKRKLTFEQFERVREWFESIAEVK